MYLLLVLFSLQEAGSSGSEYGSEHVVEIISTSRQQSQSRTWTADVKEQAYKVTYANVTLKITSIKGIENVNSVVIISPHADGEAELKSLIRLVLALRLLLSTKILLFY